MRIAVVHLPSTTYNRDLTEDVRWCAVSCALRKSEEVENFKIIIAVLLCYAMHIKTK